MDCSCKFKLLLYNLCFFCLLSQAQQRHQNKLSILSKSQPGAFPLVAAHKAAIITFDSREETVVHIASTAFQNDIKQVTGITPTLDTTQNLKTYSIIIGTIGQSKWIDELIKTRKLDVSKIKDQWESFSISVVSLPGNNCKQALVIAGSDPRGTAFGVFELSKKIGVLPFYWWADIIPENKKEIFISGGAQVNGPPSVKYRGIFINDEDWGLQPWAAKTFEPGTGDIGPKTYAKVFELLLRLKANLIWPAMHPGTKAFFHYPGNPKVAADYAIIIGSSHAEPMLRNNVGEWDEKTMGHFNYVSNRDTVYKYWEERVKQSVGINAIYTVGMRGVHDGKMEGVKDEKEAVPLLERIIADQGKMLSYYLKKDVTTIPQVFTAYKEVLDIYDAGLQLPSDITLTWPDDNYGYIQRLNNDEEKKRIGGSGVYYHASYWGRPHDYLWLSTTHPSLVREEMMKAYSNGATRLWVLNVGDIKPAEYNIEQFLDMAYDAKPFADGRYVKTHLSNWATTIFGKINGKTVQEIVWQYYQLAFERKPEFMGWSQTEPTTKTNFTGYNHFFYGDEAQVRLDKYESIEKKLRALRVKIPGNRRDAFYELVYYPVVAASWMNKKFLYRDKAVYYREQGRLSSFYYADLSQSAYDSIIKETEFYNSKLADGKWSGIMSMKPRDLPVFQPTVFALMNMADGSWGIAPEGFVKEDSSLVVGSNDLMVLPQYDDVHRQKYFVDIFLSGSKPVTWTARVSEPWIRLSQRNGALKPESLKSQDRIYVMIDWSKAPKQATSISGKIVFKADGKSLRVAVNGRRLNKQGLLNFRGAVEDKGYVVIHSSQMSIGISANWNQWSVLPDLGYTGSVLESVAGPGMNASLLYDTAAIKNNSAVASCEFYTFTAAPAVVNIFTLPTHPLNNQFSMRYGVIVDNGPIQLLDFKTFGRSEAWKQNVLSNRACMKIQTPFLPAGKHQLKIFAVDPGVLLDEIRVDLGGLKKAYSVLPETK